MSQYNPAPALGMTLDTPNDQVKQTAFQFAVDVGYMIFATISLDGTAPTARGLEVHYLDNEGNLYLGVAKGKPCYFEFQKNPWTTGVIVRETVGRLSASVRITTHLTEVDPAREPEIYQRYWEQNPGTKALYRKDLDMFRIFRFDRGEGEIFHLPEPDVTCRVRFSFGGESPRPWAYTIDKERCVGCGVCQEACMENVIHPGADGTYEIDHFMCLECGRCAMHCPTGAAHYNGSR